MTSQVSRKCAFCLEEDFECVATGIDYEIPLGRICMLRFQSDAEFKKEIQRYARNFYKAQN